MTGRDEPSDLADTTAAAGGAIPPLFRPRPAAPLRDKCPGPRCPPLPFAKDALDMPDKNFAVYFENARRDGVPIRALIQRLLQRRMHPDKARDIAEEATSRAITQIIKDTFESESHFRGRLTIAAWHRACDIIHRDRPGQSLEPGNGEGITDPDPPPPDENLAPRTLYEVMAGLPENERRVLRLVYKDRLKLHELAEALGMTTGSGNARILAARKILLKAQASLHARLEDRGFDINDHIANAAELFPDEPTSSAARPGKGT